MKITVKIEDRVYEVEVGDLTARPVLAKIDCDTFEVWPVEAGEAVPGQELTATRVEPAQPPLPQVTVVATPTVGSQTAPAGQKSGPRVQAPIPGVVIEVNVKPGDEVVFGQQLVMLEAMKMKNAIRANRAGKITLVCVVAGEHVRHGQTILEYSD